MGLSVATLALAKKYTDEQIDNVSSSIPPDWNQNDETAPDYIKNRPFYEGEAIKEIIFDNTYINLLGQTYVQDTKPLNIKIGSLYTVYINGQSYITECYYGKEMGLEVFCLGDKNFEQAPFYLIYTALIGLFNCKFKNPLEVDKVNIKIEEVKPNIITLDRKFIQGNAGENVAGKTYIVNDVEYVANLGAEIFNDYDRNIAIGQYAHAEGNNTIAMDIGSHAEGTNTTAQGLHSHAEGYCTTAFGTASHAEGSGTIANGYHSHAEGNGTIATDCQHAEGCYNIEDATYLHIVGNGGSPNERSNAHTLDWDGNAWFSGDVYVGSTSGINRDEGSKKLVTEDFVNEQVNNLIIVSEEEPEDGTLWIDKDANEEIILAEIDDNDISDEKTWSSSKIDEELNEFSNKVSLPTSGNTRDYGTAGQFAVSDGKGGIMWRTLHVVEEVEY